ncbi:hypothetical protein LCGC14_2798170, partial [marine sediment metagenome]
MSTTKIDGVSALHCVITDACHKHHGSPGLALDVAVRRLRDEFDRCVEGWGETEGVDYHLVLTVDSPRHKQAREDDEAKPKARTTRLLCAHGGCRDFVDVPIGVQAKLYYCGLHVGLREKKVAEAPGGWDGANCPRCRGSGVRLRTGPSEPCPACGGSGEAHDYLR